MRRELLSKTRVATDDAFREKLSGDIYLENVAVTRFVLCRIEEENQTIEKFTDLWARDKGDFIWTVEHIFPQGDNIPKCWIDMIADGDGAVAEQYRESHAHRLGNLTLSGYNSKLGNKSFTDKRDRKDQHGKSVGYKNGLFLNKTLKDAQNWTITDIDERTKTLVETAVQLFALEVKQ